MRVVLRFTVLGEPKGKGRPRFARAGKYIRTYTPDETVLYENLIHAEYRRQCGKQKFSDNDQLVLRVKAYYPIPRSEAKWRRVEMEAGVLRPIKKPDWDNVGKIVSDALNNVAYRDDAQIVDARVQKHYSINPRLEVTIQTAEIKGGLS